MMHRLRSRNVVTRFKLASWAFILKWSLVIASLGLLLDSFLFARTDHAPLALGFLVASVVMGLFQWAVSARTRCPLCLMPPLVRRGCSKSVSAKRLLGSYRFLVACSVILKRRFRCPYCGGLTEVKVRQDHGTRSVRADGIR